MEAETEEKPKVKPEVTPEALNAAGQSCMALATAIAALTHKDMFDEARELVDQLRLTSRSLRWLIREGRTISPPELMSKINTKGMKLEPDAPICLFMKSFILAKASEECKAIDLINAALDKGFNKDEVFKAKEVLGIKVRTKFRNKWWSLPDVDDEATIPAD